MTILLRLLPAFAAVLFAASPAFAHHAMGGEMPNTLVHGLLSGLAHPVIGFDHLAFIVAVGLAAAFATNRYLLPLAFVGGTVGGCLLIVGGVTLPGAEIVVTGSAVLVGAMVLSGRRVPDATYLAIFALAGLFHGWAYGEAIVGAETTPLLAYLIGFAGVQYAIAVGCGWAVTTVARADAPAHITPRLAGAVALGVGLAFLVENIEGLIFPAV